MIGLGSDNNTTKYWQSTCIYVAYGRINIRLAQGWANAHNTKVGKLLRFLSNGSNRLMIRPLLMKFLFLVIRPHTFCDSVSKAHYVLQLFTRHPAYLLNTINSTYGAVTSSVLDEH